MNKFKSIIGNNANRVEIIISHDNKEKTVGQKNDLLRYVWWILEINVLSGLGGVREGPEGLFFGFWQSLRESFFRRVFRRFFENKSPKKSKAEKLLSM